MGKMNPYHFKGVDHEACWHRLRHTIKAHREMDHLDKETLWFVSAFMDLIENVKPLPEHIYEPHDLAPRYFLQSDPKVSDDVLAMELHKAAQRHQKIDSRPTVGKPKLGTVL